LRRIPHLDIFSPTKIPLPCGERFPRPSIFPVFPIRNPFLRSLSVGWSSIFFRAHFSYFRGFFFFRSSSLQPPPPTPAQFLGSHSSAQERSDFFDLGNSAYKRQFSVLFLRWDRSFSVCSLELEFPVVILPLLSSLPTLLGRRIAKALLSGVDFLPFSSPIALHFRLKPVSLASFFSP